MLLDRLSNRCRNLVPRVLSYPPRNEVTVVAPSKEMQDSLGFWIPDRGFRIPGTGLQTLSVKLGVRIPIASWIPVSLSCN